MNPIKLMKWIACLLFSVAVIFLGWSMLSLSSALFHTQQFYLLVEDLAGLQLSFFFCLGGFYFLEGRKVAALYPGKEVAGESLVMYVIRHN